MRQFIFLVVGVVLGVGLIASRAGSLSETGVFEQGAYKDATSYSEELSLGDLKAGIYRSAFAIPQEYGKLVAITPSRGATVLWFESDQGVIRNAMVSSTQLLIIRRQGSVVSDTEN
jgi:hypothetical protein